MLARDPDGKIKIVIDCSAGGDVPKKVASELLKQVNAFGLTNDARITVFTDHVSITTPSDKPVEAIESMVGRRNIRRVLPYSQLLVQHR